MIYGNSKPAAHYRQAKFQSRTIVLNCSAAPVGFVLREGFQAWAAFAWVFEQLG
jgi:hypothetical protein